MVRYGYLLPTREIVAADATPEVAVSRSHAELLRAAKRAESYGFDSLWAGDSVLAKPRHDPLVTLAAVAAETDSVDVGTAVYLPTLRHPATVAQQTATVSLLSGGRFRFGVGVGIGRDVRTEYEQLAVPYERRGAMLNEHLDVVRRLWEDKSVTYDGDFFSLEEASIGMTPTRDPPVYVASLGTPSDGFHPLIEERIQTHGDGWLPGQLSPEAYAEAIDRFERVTTSNPDALLYIDVLVGDRDRCLRQARKFYDRYYPDESDTSMDDVLADVIAGSPSNVQEQLDRYVDAGVEEFVVRFPSTQQHDQLRSFSRVLKRSNG